MTIANDVAEMLGKKEVEGIRRLSDGGGIDKPMEKRLKALGIYDPKGRRSHLTLYGRRVIELLKEKGKWQS